MTSQLKVDRISPATGSEIIIDGLGGGVSNIHMSSKNSDTPLVEGVWTRVIHDVNFIGNPNFNSSTGVYTVGTGEAGLYFANFNCNVWGTTGTSVSLSGIYVNDAIRLKGNTSNSDGYGLGIACPSTGILDLNDGDEVTIYAQGTYRTGTQSVKDEAGLHTATWTMFKIGGAS